MAGPQDNYNIGITQKPQIVTDPFDTDVTVSRGAMALAGWSQISVNVLDETGAPAASAVGTITGESMVAGTSEFVTFDTLIDLASDEWSWDPNFAAIKEFKFTVAGLTANYSVVVTINSWT